MLSLCSQTLSILVPCLVGLVQGLFALRCSRSQWYRNLIKAPFHPSGSVILFSFILMNGIMGYASVRVCSQYHWFSSTPTVSSTGNVRHEQLVKLSLISYLVQFSLNGIWPILFFICRKPTLALIQIISVDAAVVFSLKLFYYLDPVSGYLTIPHLIWTVWWTLLLYSVWLLNLNTSLSLHEEIIRKDGTNTSRNSFPKLCQENVTSYGVI